MTDDLLREASDPLTPGERLRELVAHEGPVSLAALRNPNLPVDLLRDWLLGDATADLPRSLSYDTAVWSNPAVPLLLLRDPLPAYQDSALWVLSGLTSYGSLLLDAETLDEAIDQWARHLSRDMTGDRRREQLEACAFARHVADLFGLPWPD